MNKEKLKGYFEKVKSVLGKVSKKIWILIAVAVVLIAAAVVIFMNTRPYATLITGATSDEAGAVVTWLESQGVTDYRLEGTGTILVPEGQAHTLKARLLMEQYSQGSSSFSGYFERVSALSTQLDRNTAKWATLIEEFEKTIRAFPGVHDVRVSLNTGEDRSYVLDTNNIVEASAGVMLYMEEGKLLDDEKANAIRNYIASGVAGLDVTNVLIQDSMGNQYNNFFVDGNGNGNATEATALKLQTEQWYENRIRTNIMQLLAPAFGGTDNISVAVTAIIELGNKEIVDYDVRLPDFAQDGSTNGAGIIGTRFYAYEFVTDDTSTAGGVVGTTTNADLPTQVEQGEAVNEVQRIREGQGSLEYDNPKTQTHMYVYAGTLTDVTVAVTVNSSVIPGGTVDVDGIRSHAARAAGIIPVATEEMTADEYLSYRVSVLAMPFPVEEVVEPEPTPGVLAGIPLWVFIAAGAGLLLFAILLTVILLLRRRKRKKIEEEQKAVEELLAVAMPQELEETVQLDENGNPVSGANVMDLHTERSMELRQSIREFVDENMEVAALLVRSWLKEDGDNA